MVKEWITSYFSSKDGLSQSNNRESSIKYPAFSRQILRIFKFLDGLAK